MYCSILVPTDGSPASDRAVEHAIAIASAMRSIIAFLFVMDTLRTYREGVVSGAQALEALTEQGTLILERARKVAAEAGVTAGAELVEGDPVDEILRRAAPFDLIVMGSHGKGFLQRLTLGSVTEAVLHRIGRPLLIVRGSPA
jgi:nucleotide-binding universal stress UspA family protein